MVADSLHGNFYEDEMEPRDVAEALDDVATLVARVEPLLRP